VTTLPPTDEDAEVIERLDAGEPARSAEEAAARAVYERLFARLRDSEDITPAAGWEDRAVARWAAAKRRRWSIGAAAVIAAGVAGTLVLLPCSRARVSPSGLEVAVLGGSETVRRQDPAVGGLLRVRGGVDRPHVELRIYLDTRLVARCPGDDSCRVEETTIELDRRLTEPGNYRVVRLSSASAIPPPTEDGVDRDLLEARNVGANLDVRAIVVAK
jgi:hypothetical protein